MNRIYRWLCRRAWTAGFDAGVQDERDRMLRLTMGQRERFYFVDAAGFAHPAIALTSQSHVTNGLH